MGTILQFPDLMPRQQKSPLSEKLHRWVIEHLLDDRRWDWTPGYGDHPEPETTHDEAA